MSKKKIYIADIIDILKKYQEEFIYCFDDIYMYCVPCKETGGVPFKLYNENISKTLYEKFLKILIYNVEVKDIDINGRRIVLGVTEFVRNNRKLFEEFQGDLDETIYSSDVLNLIKGRATEGAYKDFVRMFTQKEINKEDEEQEEESI